jgi:hypothetical protein
MVAAIAPAAAAGAGAEFVPFGPVRVMDTRNGTGVAKAPVGPGQTVSLQVAGAAGVPSGVTAVVLNVTAVDPTASTEITVYPDGETRPGTSNLNVSRGETIPNLVVVPVANGKVDFYNAAGSVNLVADLSGYYTDSGSGSLLDSIGPVRVMDTRSGIGVAKAPVGPGKTISLQLAGADGVPARGVTAVVLNVTAVDPTASTDITVYPDGETRPGTSNLNVSRGETIPNLVVVPVANGKVDFYNAAGSVNLVADLSGYYSASGAAFSALGPERVMDTRSGIGVAKAPVGPGRSVSLQVAGVAGVPSGLTAVVLNVTAVDPTASTDITVYPDGGPRPGTSNLNVTSGETIPNLVVVPVGADGEVDFYNAAGSVNLVADLSGYYTAQGPSWGDAIQVPGTAALTTGTGAQAYSVSCPSAGNCTVGGDYSDSNGDPHTFVADETDGSWGNAIQLPGTESGSISSLSCASAGNCAAGGSFSDSSGGQESVADEVNGIWGNAVEIPGLAALDTGDNSNVFAVSCPSAGNCVVGGYYAESFTLWQPYVASEVNGTWGNATEVPGMATLNKGEAEVQSISCTSAGNCSAGGSYGGVETASSVIDSQAFVVNEVNGVWGNAIQVPGSAALNTGTDAGVISMSCSSAGNCSAGGNYTDSSSHAQAFVTEEVNGTWADAIEVPGTAALNTGGNGWVASVSCTSAGNCAAGGQYTDSSHHAQAFVTDEVNGTWGDSIQIPGTGLGTGIGQAFSVSCGSVGNCVAGGSYNVTVGGFGSSVAFVASEVNGTWGDAIQVPGTPAASEFSNSTVYSVSCPPSGGCAVGGQDLDYTSDPDFEAFVASQN